MPEYNSQIDSCSKVKYMKRYKAHKNKYDHNTHCENSF